MIKCVAIDDEPIALSIIEEYCKRYGDIDLRAFTSPIAGMECVREWMPDIVFMDIELNSHNGVALAKELPEDTCLIFTTAFSNYALDGFDADAVDFLHKPIFYPRFERSIEKARRFISSGTLPKETDGTITLKVEHKTVFLKLSDILYIEAMDNYVKIFRKDLSMLLPQVTMKEMESRLPSGKFVRVHRSFIISLDDIEKFSNRKIYLRGVQAHIPVGRKYIETYKKLQNNITTKLTE